MLPDNCMRRNQLPLRYKRKFRNKNRRALFSYFLNHEHHNLWYYHGILAVWLLLLCKCMIILLSLCYHPGVLWDPPLIFVTTYTQGISIWFPIGIFIWLVVFYNFFLWCYNQLFSKTLSWNHCNVYQILYTMVRIRKGEQHEPIEFFRCDKYVTMIWTTQPPSDRT